MNTRDSRSIHDLPVEVVQLIVFDSGLLDPLDVLSFALASKTMYGMVLGENEYDGDQHKALAGVGVCCRKKWWRAACLAVKRGFGDPMEKWDDVEVTYVLSEYNEDGYIKRMKRTNYSPLSWAVECGRSDLVSALLSRPNLYSPSTQSFKELESAIFLAVDMGWWDGVKVFLADHRVDSSMVDLAWAPQMLFRCWGSEFVDSRA